ncbi:DUF1318 domain-containing protein [Pendulispora brunnea]|uniref:DUF1318 domain-containing protein n=1 Tax=Pendulispora brunnea TaxID=2905690 RepID=A0ABZ2K5G1_9BACT
MIRVPVFASFVFCAFASIGCFGAPEFVTVDRATALEQQAAGSFPDLERKLNRASITPRPVPLTPKQFEALGIKPIRFVDTTEMTDADLVDGLLVQHCIGEGRDGLLVDTHSACIGAADHEDALELVQRVNGARIQLWRWMHEQRPAVSAEELRRTWREVHLRGVVCGGWVQVGPEQWEAKRC